MRIHLRRFLALLFLAIFPSCTTLSLLQTPRGDSIQRFRSGGKEIRIETFGKTNDPKVPSIIVLHGATGVEFYHRFIAGFAKDFSRKGFVVHLVHYFDRDGTEYADDDTIRRSSHVWQETVRDAVRQVRSSRPQAPLGIFGYSLGGYLAAAETVRNERIDAAVVLAGGLDKGSGHSVRRTPPTLILHGSADVRVPLSEGQRLEAALQRAGGKPEMHVYNGQGHIMDLATFRDITNRSTTFFREHLVPR
jgi:carboxymethylenebutenolidase